MSSNEREVVNIMPNIFTIDYHSPQCIFFLQIPTGDLKQILLQRSLQKKKNGGEKTAGGKHIHTQAK